MDSLVTPFLWRHLSMFDLLLETFFFYGTVIVEHDFMGYSNIVVPIKNQKSNVYTKIYYRIQLRLKRVFFKSCN